MKTLIILILLAAGCGGALGEPAPDAGMPAPDADPVLFCWLDAESHCRCEVDLSGWNADALAEVARRCSELTSAIAR